MQKVRCYQKFDSNRL